MKLFALISGTGPNTLFVQVPYATTIAPSFGDNRSTFGGYQTASLFHSEESAQCCLDHMEHGVAKKCRIVPVQVGDQ